MSIWKSESEIKNFSDILVKSANPNNDSKYSQIIGLNEIVEDKSDSEKTIEDLSNKIIKEAKKNAELEKHNAVVDAKLDAIQKSVDDFKARLLAEITEDESGSSDTGSSDNEGEATEDSQTKEFSIKSDIREIKENLDKLNDLTEKVENLSNEVESIKSEVTGTSDELDIDSDVESSEDSIEESIESSSDEDYVDNEGESTEPPIELNEFSNRIRNQFNKLFMTPTPKYIVRYEWEDGIGEFTGTLNECKEFITVNEARISSGEQFDVISGPDLIDGIKEVRVSKFSEFSNRLNSLNFSIKEV